LTLPPDHDAPTETMWVGRFITAKKQGRWEYVSRARGIRAAVILAIDDGHVLLVDQYRVPLGRRCLELPAGLIGDDSAGEAAEVAAARELEEETGYRAGAIVDLGEFCSSPGMVSESLHLMRARDLVRVGDGGGVDDEGIVVHRVALADVPRFVAEMRGKGYAVDVKLLLLLAGDILNADRA